MTLCVCVCGVRDNGNRYLTSLKEDSGVKTHGWDSEEMGTSRLEICIKKRFK